MEYGCTCMEEVKIVKVDKATRVNYRYDVSFNWGVTDFYDCT